MKSFEQIENNEQVIERNKMTKSFTLLCKTKDWALGNFTFAGEGTKLIIWPLNTQEKFN